MCVERRVDRRSINILGRDGDDTASIDNRADKLSSVVFLR